MAVMNSKTLQDVNASVFVKRRLEVPELTRTNKKFIRLAYESLPCSQCFDVHCLVSAVVDELAKNYGTQDPETGEYYLSEEDDSKLERINMATSLAIKEKVELWLAQMKRNREF